MTVAALALALTGCSTAGPLPPEPTAPASSVSIPSGGRTLRELGFRNGPIDRLSAPADAMLHLRVDQPNVVTLVFSQPAAPALLTYYRAALPAAGFTIGADGGGGLRFSDAQWDGSFASGTDLAGLTLRKR